MPYCSRCGVEVDIQVGICPLCEAPIQRLPPNDGSPWPAEETPAPSPPSLSTDERIALAKTITTLGFLIPTAMVLTLDWFTSRHLSWSLVVLVSLGAAWMGALLPLMLMHRPYALIVSLTIVAIALEWGLGLLLGSTDWILIIGMPLVLTTGVLVFVVTFLSRRAKRIGGNLAGWILIAAGIISIITDILISGQFLDLWRPGWSIIVVSTMIPVAAMFLYLHYRPSRQHRLRRYFHV